MSETSQLPPSGVLSEQVAYRIAAVIHPQNAESQPGEISDDIDYEASLRERAAELDPESEAIIKLDNGREYVEKELRVFWLEEAELARASTHARNDTLAAEYEAENRLIEAGIFTADTDQDLKDAYREEYEKKEKLIEYIRAAAENPTDENLAAVEVWSGLHKKTKLMRERLERHTPKT